MSRRQKQRNQQSKFNHSSQRAQLNQQQLSSPNKVENIRIKTTKWRCFTIVSFIFVLMVAVVGYFLHQQSDTCEQKLNQIKTQCQTKLNEENAKILNVYNEENKKCFARIDQQSSKRNKIFDDLTASRNPARKKPVVPQPKKPAYFPKVQQLSLLESKKDLIIVTPAKKQASLSILFNILSMQRQNFFQWHLWLRTQQQSQINFINKLDKQKQWIKVIKLQTQKTLSKSMQAFYKQDCIQNKIYLRLDEGIIWTEKSFIQTLFNHKQKLAKHLLVFPNVINNPIHAYIHQHIGAYAFPENVQYNNQGNAYKKAQIGAQLHMQFQYSIKTNQLQKWKQFKPWLLNQYERMHLNAFMYYSQTIRSIELLQAEAESQFLYSSTYSRMHKKPSLILNEPICVYGMYSPQVSQYQSKYPQLLGKYNQLL